VSDLLTSWYCPFELHAVDESLKNNHYSKFISYKIIVPKQKEARKNVVVVSETVCFPCHTQTIINHILAKEYEI
jgi:hypothetical protein